MAPWRTGPDHVRIRVRLTPKGGRDSLDGIGRLADGSECLLARVRQPPDRGAANRALLKLVADALGIPRSAAAIVSGETARLKEIRVEGDPAGLLARLERLQSSGPTD